MQSRACLQFGHAASIRNRLRRANGAIQASSLQRLPSAPGSQLKPSAPRQSASSHNLYAPNTTLNAALTPSPGHISLVARMVHEATTSVPIVYQHEARGADATITNAIDTHVEP